jgi:hypothetical protein
MNKVMLSKIDIPHDITIYQLDITKPDIGVEIQIKDDSKVIWVNVDGICVLRICQISNLIVNDERSKKC